MKIITDQRCATYRKAGHPETPERVLWTQALLTAQQRLPITWVEPEEATERRLLRIHTAEHLARLAEPADFDPNTPWYPEIDVLARRAAGAAQQAVASTLAGEPAFSLMRPPGHHALAARAMGFCYLANAALAALAAREAGVVRVAVFDFDVHHGNGTEAALVDREGFWYLSVHRSPGFPHTGLADRGPRCRNCPVAPFAARPVYRDALSRALDALAEAEPELVIVSAGFDAHREDPIGKELLEIEDFAWLGEQVRALGVPACHLLEGGYGPALSELILAYLCAVSGC